MLPVKNTIVKITSTFPDAMSSQPGLNKQPICLMSKKTLILPSKWLFFWCSKTNTSIVFWTCLRLFPKMMTTSQILTRRLFWTNWKLINAGWNAVGALPKTICEWIYQKVPIYKLNYELSLTIILINFFTYPRVFEGSYTWTIRSLKSCVFWCMRTMPRTSQTVIHTSCTRQNT